MHLIGPFITGPLWADAENRSILDATGVFFADWAPASRGRCLYIVRLKTLPVAQHFGD